MYFTDEQPFLDAVFDRYADDRPRLVYADFLDDSGEPDRAELIRVQLALARLGADDPRRPALSDRQVELLARTRAAWTAHLAGLVVSVDFHRGIPDSVSVDADTFLARGDDLFRRLRVRRLRLLDPAPLLAKLAASPLLARVRALDLCSGDLGNAGLVALLRSPFLKQLEALDLGFNGLDDGGVDALARCCHLLELTTLALNDNDRITGCGLRALADSPFFAGLTALDVSGNEIDAAGAAAVVGSRAMDRLRTFSVNNNNIGDAGVKALAASPLFARVLADDSKLELRSNAIGPIGAAALAACPALAACTELDLTGNYLGDAGVAALLRSPHLGRLKVLKLGHNQLEDRGVSAARALFDALFDRVQVLDLSCNRLTRYGMSILSDVRNGRPVRVEVGGNVQAAPPGYAPVAVSDLVPGLLNGIEAAHQLRHRVTHPRHRNDGT
ncbi:TIGR02996 domain-containing protein [Frigoriglobus tundricola]|uniref:Uncharacterized protein n=1 Tax=Frigoriglobus tundricola TaxID=2774151 RepID=A0A6M5YZG4_9BACT|nr:TIGR02996 domain-containing protein [Frigoriglobus tundricola]QJW98924.1 hypothetical protein FTUN_6519 [Frigoriglobus tundricola]